MRLVPFPAPELVSRVLHSAAKSRLFWEGVNRLNCRGSRQFEIIFIFVNFRFLFNIIYINERYYNMNVCIPYYTIANESA